MKAAVKTTPLPGAVLLPIGQVRANPDNPRENFDEAELRELADSLRDNGFLQPLVVRYDPSRYDATPYILIAGGRRLRAAELAGITDVPCVVRDTNASHARDLALIENIQRQNLRPIEEAQAFAHRMEESKMSLRDVARHFKKSKSYVENRLDLLKCPPDVQQWVNEHPDKMSHALAVRKVSQKPFRSELLGLAEHGASVEELRTAIVENEQKEQARDEAGTPPDAHTAHRATIAAEHGSAPLSRGYNLTSSITPAQAQAAVDESLSRLLSAARGANLTLREWQPHGAQMNHEVAAMVVAILREMGSEFVLGEVVER